ERTRPCVNTALSRIGADATAEYLFVDDGSTDRTPDVLSILSGLSPDVRFLRLSRNFGKEAALAAGLRHARGDAAIPMDVDLQDPPELIPAMVDHWLGGARVVNARRADRASDSVWKRWSARAFYRVINAVADEPIPADVGDYRLLDRAAVTVINQLGEKARFNKGLFSWVGFRVAEVSYVREARDVGTTKWRIRGLWRLALDGITSSTTAPLRVWTYVGAATAVVAMGFAAWLVARTLIFGVDTPGYASLMVTMLMLGAFNLLSLGIMGEYIGRIAKEVRGRPLYIVESDSADTIQPAQSDRNTIHDNQEENGWTALPMRA
ncbi:MAG: glycosyltransferase family 2 protein, partial [Sphingopyxis sp.]|nr:glycosyltransferase family 2 protein [Sphingopyxis sp.]